MFSSYTKRSDLRNSVENFRQTRPFEIARCAYNAILDGNLSIEPGYKGTTIINDSYFFVNTVIDVNVNLSPGDTILLYGQDDPIQNGIWTVISIVSGYVNIQRPPDYAKRTPIRSGQCVLIIKGENLHGRIFKNMTPEYDSNQNKIFSYNGFSPQNWEPYRFISLTYALPYKDDINFFPY